MRKIFLLLILIQLILLSGLVFGQIPLDSWTKINQGFAKCPAIGIAGGEAVQSRDDFEVKTLLDRRGTIYAYLRYGNSGTNAASCQDGLFKYDSVMNVWTRVAGQYPGAYGGSSILTNHEDIYVAFHGRVYKHVEDYSLAPNGWLKISKAPHDPLLGSQVFSNGCSPSNSWEPLQFNTQATEIVGDTIYVFQPADCPAENRVLKFNVHNGYWTFDIVGPLPHQSYNFGGQGGNGNGMVFTHRIAGIFNYFVKYTYDGRNKCVPDYMWTWDPRVRKWINISRGIEWHNQTGSSCTTPVCRSCIDNGNFSTDVGANWGPAGGIYPSWDKRKLFVSSEKGIWRWAGDKWYWVGDNRENSSILGTETAIFTKGRDRGIEKLEPTNYAMVGGNLPIGIGTEWKNLWTPDDGRTLFVIYGISASRGNPDSLNGIHILRYNPDKPDKIRNIHIETGTYIGGPGDNSPINTGVGAFHQLFIAGNFSQVTGKFAPGFYQTQMNGASPSNRGKIIRMNTFGDTIYSVMTLGTQIYDYEIQNFGEYRMVVAGNWGVTCLDSTGTRELWTIPFASIPGSGNRVYADIDDLGNVVVLKASGSQDYNLTGGRFSVYDRNGILKNAGGRSITVASTDTHNGGADYVNDITIKNDTIYVVGFNNDRLNGTGCGETSGLPVQSCYVRAFVKQGANYELIWRTFDIRGKYLNLDQADTRGYKINVGKDGKVYYLGETAGGNSYYRWDGKTSIALQPGCSNPSGRSKLVQYDSYNSPYNTASAHIAYFATINPKTGEVEKGQYIIPRLRNGKSNSYRVSEGYIHADKLGYIYIGANAAYAYAGRDIQHLNGNLIAPYDGGDMVLLIVDPSHRVRTFWGTFSKDKGSGNLSGIGLRDNIITAIGQSPKGVMYTGGTRFNQATGTRQWNENYAMIKDPFTPLESTFNDAYLAVWYQDVWNHSTQDSLDERKNPGDTLVSEEEFNYRPNFASDKQAACIGEPVTFTNTSVGDTLYWKWDFGAGASLLPGTNGEGPHVVSYSTPGLKSVKLITKLKNGVEDYEFKQGYINVLDPSYDIGPISGPLNVCSGVPVFYSVRSSFDITFRWTLPAGAQMTRGSNGNTIQVVFGPTGGTLKVEALSACGVVSSNSMNISVTPPGDNNALLIVGNTNLSFADQLIRTKLVEEGFNVIVLADSISNESHAGCAGLVFISPSVSASKVNYKFRNVSIPVITSNSALFDDMGLTNGSSSDIGTTLTREVNIVLAGHQLAGTLTNGIKQVYQSNVSVNWGLPAATAIKVATISGSTTQHTVFAYTDQSAMMGMSAPSRRVAFYMAPSTIALTANGEQLLERAICWAAGTCPVPNIITTGALASTTYCPGAAIQIPFTATGTFNSGNKFIAQLSNPYGDFTNVKTLGTIVSTAGGTIQGVIPQDAVTGTNYRVRVISTDPSATGTDNGIDLRIAGAPLPPVTIYGNQLACRWQTTQVYSIDPVPGADYYVWQSPLGTTITGAPFNDENRLNTTGTSITVNFGTATSNEIKVYSGNGCGLSTESARLMVSMTADPPLAPSSMSGKQVVCNAAEEIYAISPVQGASSYEWVVPSGATIVSGQGTNAALVSFAGMADVASGSIKVKSVGQCGPSTAEFSYSVTVDNAASVPTTGPITERSSFCTGNYTYSIDPLQGATSYNWTLPAGAIGSSSANSIDVTFSGNVTGSIKVSVTTACGTSAPSVKNVSISANGKKAMLIVGDKTNLTTVDNAFKNRLESLGYAVVLRDDDDAIGMDINCVLLGVISGSVNPEKITPFKNVSVPLIATNSLLSRNHVYYQLGFSDRNIYNGATTSSTASATQIRIQNSVHPITNGLSGNVSVYSSPSNVVWGQPAGQVTLLGSLTNDNSSSTLFVYDQGARMYSGTAADIRIGFFSHQAVSSMTSTGWTIFDNCVCYAVGECSNHSITTGTISGSPFCPGLEIRVPFITTGIYSSGNIFKAELSNASGSFSSPVVIGTFSGTVSGTINATIPLNASAGTNYRIRVISTNPSVTGSDNGVNLVISSSNTWYADADNDSYGDPSNFQISCSRPAGYVGNNEDCNDTDPLINPNKLWFEDRDGDTFGNPSASMRSCVRPNGYVENNSDCDDTDADLKPTTVWYADADGDGFGDPNVTEVACTLPNGFVDNNQDCNDSDTNLNPLTKWYADTDQDNFGDPVNFVQSCVRPNGYVADNTDCNDSEAAVNPSRPWYFDGDGDAYGNPSNVVYACTRPNGYVANNEDCDDTDPSLNAGTVWYADGDNDTYGNALITFTGCVPPSGYVRDATDCDDGNSGIHPEVTWFADADGDGFGNPASSIQSCTQPNGFVRDNRDCNDNQTAAYPGASEICDGIDNDCDQLIDEDGGSVWYRDADSDGYGDASNTVTACVAPQGFVADNTDCNDNDATLNPATIWYQDLDIDGFGNSNNSIATCNAPSGYVRNNTDCNDNDPASNPTKVWHKDLDADGFGDPLVTVQSCLQPNGYVENSTDCNDADATVHPDKQWYHDFDGDTYGDPAVIVRSCIQPFGYVDNNGDCNDTDPSLHPMTNWYRDQDGDTFGDAASVLNACTPPTGYVRDNIDCNDNNASLNPATVWYRDADGDTYGNNQITLVACIQPQGYVRDNTDCDDANSQVSPATQWYRDADQDGYGDPATVLASCTLPQGYVSDPTDCNDGDGLINPATMWYADSDRDGFGNPSLSFQGCVPPSGHVMDKTDCDDAVTGKMSPQKPSAISGSTAICEGWTSVYEVTPVSGATSYSWTLPSGATGSSSTHRITLSFTIPVNGNLTVTAFNGCGTSQGSSIAITHNVPPETPGAIQGTKEVCRKKTISYYVVPVPGANYYNWNAPSGAIIKSGQGTTSVNVEFGDDGDITGYITVIASNDCGSSGMRQDELVDGKCSEDDLFIPNTFTPGSSDGNSVWDIGGINDYPDVKIVVVNRWGSVIYESTNYEKPWDGTFNGKLLPTGTYYYTIDLQNGDKPKVGSVTIVH